MANYNYSRQDDAYLIVKGETSLGEDFTILEADASHDYSDRTSAVAYKITQGGRSCRIKTEARTRPKGPGVAELCAINVGLQELRRKGVKKVLVRTDNKWCLGILAGTCHAAQTHTIPTAKTTIKLMKDFDTVHVKHTRTKDMKAVDRAARKTLGKAKEIKQQVNNNRRSQLNKTIGRAKDVIIERMNGYCLGNGYRCSVGPPSCECPQWKDKWKDKSLVAKRARRLPCKHIVAMALQEGMEEDELIKLGYKAVE